MKRNTLLAIAAILLPTMVFASVFFAYLAATDQDTAKARAIAAAAEISRDLDVEAGRTAISLQILASSSALARRDWPAAAVRARVVADLNPEWRTVTLLDLRSGRTVFTTKQAEKPLSPANFTAPLEPGKVVFDGIARRPGRCTCVLAGEALTQKLDGLALVVELDPQTTQSNLLKKTPARAVSAVVDRKGNFIGRSVDFTGRVGTPATTFVRDAIRSGPNGFYKGRTYEGLENYTAFQTSAVTGWSSHMAVSSNLIQGPRRQRLAALAVAACISILSAVLLLLALIRVQASRREEEERRAESQRLESLGRLTGGIAHDFNNMLTIITSGIDLALKRTPDDPKVRRYLDAAAEGARRANDLTKRMLAYARRQRLTPTVLDPNSLLEDMAELLDRTLGDDVKVRCELEAGLWLIRADRSELENAILNLATNARDAMPGGGVLTLSACNLEEYRSKGGDKSTANCLQICVEDSGEGIPAEILSRVTEPFYTTKGAGQGTGLGLSQVAGFVRQSGGEVTISSTPQAGTRVCMVLPRYDGPEEIAPAGVTPSGELRDFGLAVMLVEDDDGVREATTQCLGELGHEVTSFENGAAALKALPDGRYDLVISDFQMPGMDGETFGIAARKIRPGLPVLLMSACRDAETAGAFPLLAKPFSLEALRAAIAKVMNEAKSRT